MKFKEMSLRSQKLGFGTPTKAGERVAVNKNDLAESNTCLSYNFYVGVPRLMTAGELEDVVTIYVAISIKK